MIEHCWNLCRSYFPLACHEQGARQAVMRPDRAAPCLLGVQAQFPLPPHEVSQVSGRGAAGAALRMTCLHCSTQHRQLANHSPVEDTSANQRAFHLQCTDICSTAPARSPRTAPPPGFATFRDIETKNIFCKSFQLETQSSIESSPLSRTYLCN